MARFATETYEPPCFSNLDNVCQHLTNYAINKDNPNFIFNTDSTKNDVGHKRSLTSVLETMKKKGIDVVPILDQVLAIKKDESFVRKDVSMCLTSFSASL